jgi:hypothetical protein
LSPLPGPSAKRNLPQNVHFRPFSTPFPIEFPGKFAYAKDADEFVRHATRERTGWRREEWAHSPLFICGKFRGEYTPIYDRFFEAVKERWQ